MNHLGNCLRVAVFSATAALVCVAIGCSSPTATGGRNTTPTDDTAQVIAVAERDYASFLNKIPKGHEADYGFDDRPEFDRVEVGAPLRVHAVDVDYSGPFPRAIKKIRALDQWRVPLTVNGKQRALLTVVKKDGRFEAADFGGAGLARSLYNLNTTIAASRFNASYLVRVVAIRQDFWGVSESGKDDRLYPASPGTRESSRLPSSSIAAAPTVPNASLSQAELFSLIDEQVKGGAK
jgi:hypothetical protein